MRAALKRVGRVLLWPLRRFFDPRFQGLSDGIGQVIASNAESTTVLGRSVADTQATAEELLHVAADELRPMLAELHPIVAETRTLAERASGAYFERLTTGSPAELDAEVAHLLNYAESHRGFAAQRRLWFNPPVSLKYEPHGIKLVEVNERIAEIPFAYRALARIDRG